MKRLALLVAAVAALVLFTACPNKPTDEEVYYSEEIALHAPLLKGGDTTIYFFQEFTMNGNTLIYDPTSPVNSDRPYVNFVEWINPICSIINDSIIYFKFLYADGILGNANFESVKAKLDWSGKNRDAFTFSYTLRRSNDLIMSATHTCNRIKSLSD